MDQEFYEILVFGHKTARTQHLRIPKKNFKTALYLTAFGLLTVIFFFCDYIQVKTKAFELSQLRRQTETQRIQLHSFSTQIEQLEKQLSKLNDFDSRIRIIANLEKGEQAVSLMGMGGPSLSDTREKLKAEKDESGLIQQMNSDVERLKKEAISREESLSELEKLLEAKKAMLAQTPSIWPSLGWLTSTFGFRTDPYTGLNQMHEGIDIANRVGTPVIATADGIVSDTANDGSHGIMVVVSHGFGMTSRYCHLSRILVRAGQRIKRGQKIAEVGSTGRSTGPHLHYEVRLNGIPVNPMRYILN